MGTCSQFTVIKKITVNRELIIAYHPIQSLKSTCNMMNIVYSLTIMFFLRETRNERGLIQMAGKIS